MFAAPLFFGPFYFMVVIYKISSPTNKIYIGQSWCIEKRIMQYEKKHCIHQKKLHSSIIKYGWENHKLEILTILPKDILQSVLNDYEFYYWQQYIDCGFEMLNIKEPGSNGKHSENTKELMRKNRKGKRIGENNPMFGKGHLISGENHGMFGKLGELHFSSVKINQYSMNDEFIKTWNSLADIQRELKLGAGNICNVCKGKRNSAGNYKWKYKK